MLLTTGRSTCGGHHAARRRFVGVAQRQQSTQPSTRVYNARANPETLEGQHYEDIVEQLAQRVISLHSKLSQETGRTRVLVGIAGSPGSGKSTLSQLVCDRINALDQDKTHAESKAAAVVPMDGFHLYRHQLDRMPDPVAAYARRGAPWTFDAAAFVQCVHRIRHGGEVMFPSFDHAVGDPIENDLQVSAGTKMVLVEGNYLLISEDPWNQLQGLFDEAWFVDCPLEVAMARVLERQVGNGADEAQARARVNDNDRKNALMVMASKEEAQVLVPSSIPFCGQQ